MRRRGQWYSHWCSLLDFHLKRKSLTGQAFAALVGSSQQMVHSYQSGKTRPPLELVQRWAKALKLNSEEERQFIQAAYEAWTPQPIWARLVELEGRAWQVQLTPSRLQSDLDICRAATKDLVAILKDLEDLFYTRIVPFHQIRDRRELLGIAVRRAIERYDRAG